MSEPATYPPDPHVTRDLAPIVERDESGSTILLPVTPALLDDWGRLRAGPVATVVDIVCGETAIREVLPQWIATSTLSLQLAELPTQGTLRAQPRVLRKGRTTLVQEVALDHVETGGPLGLGTVAFSILPGKNPLQSRAVWAEEPEPRSTFANATSGFEKPLLEQLGLRFDEEDPTVARLDVRDYVINTLGAMQGGVVAMLIDATGERFARHALGGPVRVRGLEIHYLKLARHGPVRATARLLGEIGAAEGGGLIVRVELHDEGGADVLLTLATLIVDRAPH